MNRGISGLLVMFELDVVRKKRLCGPGLSYGEEDPFHIKSSTPNYLFFAELGSMDDRLSGETRVCVCVCVWRCFDNPKRPKRSLRINGNLKRRRCRF